MHRSSAGPQKWLKNKYGSKTSDRISYLDRIGSILGVKKTLSQSLGELPFPDVYNLGKRCYEYEQRHFREGNVHRDIREVSKYFNMLDRVQTDVKKMNPGRKRLHAALQWNLDHRRIMVFLKHAKYVWDNGENIYLPKNVYNAMKSIILYHYDPEVLQDNGKNSPAMHCIYDTGRTETLDTLFSLVKALMDGLCYSGVKDSSSPEESRRAHVCDLLDVVMSRQRQKLEKYIQNNSEICQLDPDGPPYIRITRLFLREGEDSWAFLQTIKALDRGYNNLSYRGIKQQSNLPKNTPEQTLKTYGLRPSLRKTKEDTSRSKRQPIPYQRRKRFNSKAEKPPHNNVADTGEFRYANTSSVPEQSYVFDETETEGSEKTSPGTENVHGPAHGEDSVPQEDEEEPETFSAAEFNAKKNEERDDSADVFGMSDDEGSLPVSSFYTNDHDDSVRQEEDESDISSAVDFDAADYGNHGRTFSVPGYSPRYYRGDEAGDDRSRYPMDSYRAHEEELVSVPSPPARRRGGPKNRRKRAIRINRRSNPQSEDPLAAYNDPQSKVEVNSSNVDLHLQRMERCYQALLRCGRRGEATSTKMRAVVWLLWDTFCLILMGIGEIAGVRFSYRRLIHQWTLFEENHPLAAFPPTLIFGYLRLEFTLALMMMIASWLCGREVPTYIPLSKLTHWLFDAKLNRAFQPQCEYDVANEDTYLLIYIFRMALGKFKGVNKFSGGYLLGYLRDECRYQGWGEWMWNSLPGGDGNSTTNALTVAGESAGYGVENAKALSIYEEMPALEDDPTEAIRKGAAYLKAVTFNYQYHKYRFNEYYIPFVKSFGNNLYGLFWTSTLEPGIRNSAYGVNRAMEFAGDTFRLYWKQVAEQENYARKCANWFASFLKNSESSWEGAPVGGGGVGGIEKGEGEREEEGEGKQNDEECSSSPYVYLLVVPSPLYYLRVTPNPETDHKMSDLEKYQTTRNALRDTYLQDEERVFLIKDKADEKTDTHFSPTWLTNLRSQQLFYQQTCHYMNSKGPAACTSPFVDLGRVNVSPWIISSSTTRCDPTAAVLSLLIRVPPWTQYCEVFRSVPGVTQSTSELYGRMKETQQKALRQSTEFPISFPSDLFPCVQSSSSTVVDVLRGLLERTVYGLRAAVTSESTHARVTSLTPFSFIWERSLDSDTPATMTVRETHSVHITASVEARHFIGSTTLELGEEYKCRDLERPTIGVTPSLVIPCSFVRAPLAFLTVIEPNASTQQDNPYNVFLPTVCSGKEVVDPHSLSSPTVVDCSYVLRGIVGRMYNVHSREYQLFTLVRSIRQDDVYMEVLIMEPCAPGKRTKKEKQIQRNYPCDSNCSFFDRALPVLFAVYERDSPLWDPTEHEQGEKDEESASFDVGTDVL